MLLPLTKLLEGRDQPLCVAGDLDIQSALARMIEHDYSQLPVIDDRGDSGMVAASVEQAEREYALDYASGESAIGFLNFYLEQLDETGMAVRIDFATMNEMYPENPLPLRRVPTAVGGRMIPVSPKHTPGSMRDGR